MKKVVAYNVDEEVRLAVAHKARTLWVSGSELVNQILNMVLKAEVDRVKDEIASHKTT